MLLNKSEGMEFCCKMLFFGELTIQHILTENCTILAFIVKKEVGEKINEFVQLLFRCFELSHIVGIRFYKAFPTKKALLAVILL